MECGVWRVCYSCGKGFWHKSLLFYYVNIFNLQDKESSDEKKEVDNSDLWIEKTIDHKQRWYLEPG